MKLMSQEIKGYEDEIIKFLEKFHKYPSKSWQTRQEGTDTKKIKGLGKETFSEGWSRGKLHSGRVLTAEQRRL